MTKVSTDLAQFDSRPFFDKALRYGFEQKIISQARLHSIEEDFAKGIVQIANFFGTAHLRPEIELALRRMVNLISLYLEEISGSDLQIAAVSLRDNTFLSHSKGGSDMLRRLHTMPESTLLFSNPVSPEDQRAYLDDQTAASTILLAEYRSEFAQRQKNQCTINFACWLAKKMGSARDDVDDAEALIRTALLVIFVDQAKFQIPTRTSFVRLIKAAKNAKAKLNEKRLDDFLKEAPSEFQQLARDAMDRFIENELLQIRTAGNNADKLLYGESSLSYFINESIDEDVREYDRLVAKEWDRVTHGESDDPAVLATVFLLLASGQPPKAAMLLKEAKEVVRVFRTAGFDSLAVSSFINDHAPQAQRDDLRKFWENDLRNEAQEQLADTDPNWPDTHMDRAIEYLRKTCCATWKGRSR